jgi:hypothetical protein
MRHAFGDVDDHAGLEGDCLVAVAHSPLSTHDVKHMIPVLMSVRFNLVLDRYGAHGVGGFLDQYLQGKAGSLFPFLTSSLKLYAWSLPNADPAMRLIPIAATNTIHGIRLVAISRSFPVERACQEGFQGVNQGRVYSQGRENRLSPPKEVVPLLHCRRDIAVGDMNA